MIALSRPIVCAALLMGCAGSAPPPAPGPVVIGSSVPDRLGAEPAVRDDQLGRAWLERVHERLHERWADGFLEQARTYLPIDHPLNDPRLAATVEFTVAADGAVLEPQVTTSSGNLDFDTSARAVIASLTPLPAPPAELRSDDGGTHVTWQLARDVRQDSAAGAAIDRRFLPIAQAIPALVTAGRIDEAARRVAAGGDVGLAREVAGAALLAILDNGREPIARVAAARALGMGGWHGADATLRRLAVEANDLVLQAAALRALGELGDTLAEPLWLEAVEQGLTDRAAAGGYALAKRGRSADVWHLLGPRLVSGDERSRFDALVALAEVGALESVGALVAILTARDRPRGERTVAARALAPLAIAASDEATAALMAALSDGDASVRAAASAALAVAPVRAPSVLRAILPLVADRDPRVQLAAVAAAAAHGGVAALSALLAAAHARDPAVAEAALSALGPLAPRTALAELLRATDADSPERRAAALRALAGRAEPAARTVAARHLDDSDMRVRFAAMAGLDDPRLVAPALTEPMTAAIAAAALLGRQGAKAAMPALLNALAASRDIGTRVTIASIFLTATRAQ